MNYPPPEDVMSAMELAVQTGGWAGNTFIAVPRDQPPWGASWSVHGTQEKAIAEAQRVDGYAAYALNDHQIQYLWPPEQETP